MAVSINQNGFCPCFIAFLIHSIHGAPPLFTFNGTGTVQELNPTEHNQHLVNTSVPIIFEGKSYNQFIISKDGRIAFTADVRSVDYRAQNWEDTEVAQFIDIPFIAPYYHEGQPFDSRKGYTGHIFYQELNSADTAQQKVLLSLGEYMRSQVVGSRNFDPSWGMQITWENVTSREQISPGRCQGTVSNPCPTNTFQLVVLTDGTLSFAIFNYGSMSMSPSKFDQAGFNGGEGKGFTSIVPKSRSINDLNQIQGSDEKGRFIYQISPGKVIRGGCTTDTADTQLSVYPNFADMFGGKMLDVSGPCFYSNQQIFCKFQDQNQLTSPVVEKAIYVSQTRVRCMVPRLFIRDRVTLSLSTDNNRTFPHNAIITIVFPGRMPREEHVEAVWSKSDMAWYSYNPSSLSLSWHAELLSNRSSDRVDISLIGYRETGGMPTYTNLLTIATDQPVSNGRYDFDPLRMQCSGQQCFDYELGLLEVRLKDQFTPQTYRYLSSKAIPLGWYVQNAMTDRHGSSWPAQLCVDWYNRDKQNMAWLNSLLSCPCSLAQAIADFGRWQPDNGCNLYQSGKSGNCFYHTEAVHCVRAVQPVNGAGNQCCYGTSGLLIFAADTFQGSTPDKSHDWGAAPYGKAGYVPSLSHWIDDVVSFYYCCLWDGYNSCDNYMDLRPTKDCTGYNPPMPASVFGQGHISSFGGASYRMRGPGDYVLLRAGKTEIHARFQRNLFPTNEDNRKIETTYSLVAVAVEDIGTSDRVELRLRGPQFSTEYQHIDVRVNGLHVDFDGGALKWQDFKEVAVVQTDDTLKQSNFTVLLTNGIGLQVAEIYNTLQLDVMIPTDTFSNISGLFGDMNGNLFSPNGTSFDLKSTIVQDLYNRFQLSWAVNETTKLFSDIIPANHSFLGTIDLNPSPVAGQFINTRSVCMMDQGVISEECSFDYMYTGSQDLAGATRSAIVRNMALRHNLQPVRSCGLLNVPRSKKTNYDYVIGTTTSITECKSGTLSGTRTYTCVATSNETQAWSPDITATCEEQLEDANIGMIVGITVGIAVLLLVAVIIAVVAIRKRKEKRKRANSNKGQTKQQFNEGELEEKYDNRARNIQEKGRSNEYAV